MGTEFGTKKVQRNPNYIKDSNHGVLFNYSTSIFFGDKKNKCPEVKRGSFTASKAPQKKPDESQHTADHSSYSLHTGYTPSSTVRASQQTLIAW